MNLLRSSQGYPGLLESNKGLRDGRCGFTHRTISWANIVHRGCSTASPLGEAALQVVCAGI